MSSFAASTTTPGAAAARAARSPLRDVGTTSVEEVAGEPPAEPREGDLRGAPRPAADLEDARAPDEGRTRESARAPSELLTP